MAEILRVSKKRPQLPGLFIWNSLRVMLTIGLGFVFPYFFGTIPISANNPYNTSVSIVRHVRCLRWFEQIGIALKLHMYGGSGKYGRVTYCGFFRKRFQSLRTFAKTCGSVRFLFVCLSTDAETETSFLPQNHKCYNRRVHQTVVNRPSEFPVWFVDSNLCSCCVRCTKNSRHSLCHRCRTKSDCRSAVGWYLSYMLGTYRKFWVVFWRASVNWFSRYRYIAHEDIWMRFIDDCWWAKQNHHSILPPIFGILLASANRCAHFASTLL